MADLLTRLRDQNRWGNSHDRYEAADEIERLKGFVAKVRDAVENIDPDVLPPDASVAVATVQDALGSVFPPGDGDD